MEPIKENTSDGAVDTKSPEGDSADIANNMVQFGLQEPTDGGEKPQKEGDAGEPNVEKFTVGDKEFTADEIQSVIGKVNDLETTLQGLRDNDLQTQRDLYDKLNKVLENQLTPKTEEPKFTEEDLQRYKEEMDTKAAEDFTGTTLELAGAVVNRVTAPLLKKIEELTETVNDMKKSGEQSTQQNEARKVAMDHISGAFKASGVEVDQALWAKACNVYKENFGIDLVEQAYQNPEGMKKQLSTFLKTNGNSKGSTGMTGLPAGSGSGGGARNSSETKEEAMNKTMKEFGLIGGDAPVPLV